VTDEWFYYHRQSRQDNCVLATVSSVSSCKSYLFCETFVCLFFKPNRAMKLVAIKHASMRLLLRICCQPDCKEFSHCKTASCLSCVPPVPIKDVKYCLPEGIPSVTSLQNGLISCEFLPWPLTQVICPISAGLLPLAHGRAFKSAGWPLWDSQPSPNQAGGPRKSRKSH
jgi:hypothetical protein